MNRVGELKDKNVELRHNRTSLIENQENEQRNQVYMFFLT